MTSKRISPKAAHIITGLLAGLVKDTFDNNGNLITNEALALLHVQKHSSLSAAADVQQYGGPAVMSLRRQGYAIVPVTSYVHTFLVNPATTDETLIANSVAGTGAGGPRIGWYQPSGTNDPLWVAYIGHLVKAGSHAIFHVAQQMADNPGLLNRRGAATVHAEASTLPTPPSKAETKLLEAQHDR